MCFIAIVVHGGYRVGMHVVTVAASVMSLKYMKDGWRVFKSSNFQCRLIFPKNKLLANGVLSTVNESNANTVLNVLSFAVSWL